MSSRSEEELAIAIVQLRAQIKADEQTLRDLVEEALRRYGPTASEVSYTEYGPITKRL